MILLKRVQLNHQDMDILIKENKIFQISPDIQTQNDMEVWDCEGKAILPSFANMHTHASMMFLRGIGEDKDLFSWLSEDIWPREAKLTDEQIYQLSRYAALEMIRSGTTLFNDMYFHVPFTIKAISEMGIRGAITYLFMEDLENPDETKKRTKIAQDYLNQPVSDSKIIKTLGCHAVYTTSPEAYKIAYDLVKKHHTFLHVHSSETQKEVDDCVAKYGVRPVELLEKWGVLDNNVIIAHGVYLNDQEVALLKEKQSLIVHCPSSNMKLNSGIMPLQKYLDNGLHVALGTDSVSSNNSLSMMSEMKVAALLAKISTHSEKVGKVDDIFDMASYNGFQSLRVNAGRIQEGMLADFILVDLDNVFLKPNYNLKSNMIYAADASCIVDVFCDGKPVMKDRKIPNEDEIHENFDRVCKELI